MLDVVHQRRLAVAVERQHVGERHAIQNVCHGIAHLRHGEPHRARLHIVAILAWLIGGPAGAGDGRQRPIKGANDVPQLDFAWRARQRVSAAWSLLGAHNAGALRQYGAKPEEDCAQLWRRIVFSILISNSDDHLRNHGFLYNPIGGWRLAPAYDLNPVPVDIKPRILTTAIDEADGTASLDLAFAVAKHFGLKPNSARKIASEVGNAVKNWRQTAKTLGLSVDQINRMASAFEHKELEQATAGTDQIIGR